MTLKERKIVLIAGLFLSYETDEEVLNGYYALQDVPEEEELELASKNVMVWAPLMGLTVIQLLYLINDGITNLDKFLEKCQSSE